MTLGASICSVSRPKYVLVTKSKTLFKSATRKWDLKKHLSVSVAVCDRKHANRIPRPKVGVSLVVQANVKVVAKSLDYYAGITIVRL